LEHEYGPKGVRRKYSTGGGTGVYARCKSPENNCRDASTTLEIATVNEIAETGDGKIFLATKSDGVQECVHNEAGNSLSCARLDLPFLADCVHDVAYNSVTKSLFIALCDLGLYEIYL